MELRHVIENIFPELGKTDELGNATSFLKDLGVGKVDNLKLLRESDLMPLFNVIQLLKLLKSFSQGKNMSWVYKHKYE